MNDLTERLCSTLYNLPVEKVSVQGARLVHHVWSRFQENAKSRSLEHPPGATDGLSATSYPGRKLGVESAAFDNSFRFAEQFGLAEGSEWSCLAVPVFSATALTEARGADCKSLCYAVGLGMEAHSRVYESLAESTRRRGINPDVLAATLAAIIACGKVENLPSRQVAQALGLGSSAITAVANGYLPLQVATAARDGIVMVLLVCAGFIGPPDPLACRWGIYEVFADPANACALDLDSGRLRADTVLRRLPGGPAKDDDSLCAARGSTPVGTFLASLALT